MATLAHFAPLTGDDHHAKLDSDDTDTEGKAAHPSSAIKKQSENFFVLNTVCRSIAELGICFVG
jgi:hypothetical protein